jgi:hypothetical protein
MGLLQNYWQGIAEKAIRDSTFYQILQHMESSGTNFL